MNKLKKIDKKDIEDIIALTPTQEGMLFHYLKDQKSDYYFEQLSLTITGEIDFNWFKQAWNFVVETNEMLRTRFRWEMVKKPVQVILKRFRVQPIFHDFSSKDINVNDKRHLVEKTKYKDREERFNLNSVPFRITLCKIEERRYEMIISNHHILYDGWSTRIILEEFFSSYNDRVQQKSPVKPSKPRYREYINWIQGQDKDKQEKYWRSYLKGFEDKSELSIKRKRAKKINSAGAGNSHYKVSFSQAVREKLETFIKSHKITLACLFYSAWGILLQRYNNSDDVVFGTTVSGRPSDIKRIEDIVGLLINTIPLRVRTEGSGHERVEGFLYRLNKKLLEREGYESTSLVEIKEYGEVRFGEELFDTIVVIENYPLDKVLFERNSKSSLSVDSYSIFEMTHYDLTVGITLIENIEVEFTYKEDSFEELVIKELPGHFVRIVEDIIDNPGKELAALEILSEAEKNKILSDFNNTGAEYPQDKTIHGLFEDQVERTPDGVALVGNRQLAVGKEERIEKPIQLTYMELNRKSNQLAYLLKFKGVEPGDIVGIIVERSLDMPVGIMGILKAGGAYLPIDPNYPQERIRYMLAESNAKVLVTARTLAEEGEKVDFSTLLPEFPSPTSLAYVIYTSGTTGGPKGVMVEHRNVVNLLTWFGREYCLSSGRHVLQISDYVFDPSVEQILGTLVHGSTVYMIKREWILDKERFRRFVDIHQIDMINFVPEALKDLLLTGEGKLKSLRTVISGGDRLDDTIKDGLLREGYQLCNHYGPTEITVDALTSRCSQEKVNLGKPIANTRVYVLDRQRCPVPVGVPGELYISGDGVSRGYLNRPELTAEKFMSAPASSSSSTSSWGLRLAACGWRLYLTGDLARWLPGGNIEFLGRMDHQVKIRGFRVEPGEIESRLLTHENIKDAVVTVGGGDDREKYLCAYITSEEKIDVSRLRDELYLKLPDYMVPSYIKQLDKIPLTTSGSVDKGELPKPDWEVIGGEYTAPVDQLEETLVSVWSDVLNIEKNAIGTGHNFFKLGGHSLKAVRLISGIQKELNVEVPLQEIFKLPTIKGLSGYIRGLTEKKYVSIESAEEKEYYALSSAQRRLYVLQEMDKTATAYNMPSAWLLEGAVDKNRLESTFEKLMERHESLRTSFTVIDDEPIQRIHEKNHTFQITTTIKDFVRPFDLSQAPLLRVGLIRAEENKYILMVDMHHIISDGLSLNILIKDFTALYTGEKLPGQRSLYTYKDYAVWQGSKRQRYKRKQQGLFWLKEFESEIPVLHLPLDYPRPVVQRFDGREFHFSVSAQHSRALKALSMDTGATLYMVLLSMYMVLLLKLSNQEDIIVGTPVLGRREPDLEHIIGMFVNTLALRNFPMGEKTFTQFLKEVKERTIKAFENQDYQYEDLVESLTVNRDSGRNPLFDTMFILQDLDFPDINIPGLEITPYPIERTIAKFDLTLVCTGQEESLSCIFEYSTKLFKQDTIERFSRYFTNIISAVAENIDQKISAIDILPKEEKRQLVRDFNDTDEEFPRDKTIYQLFEEQVDMIPHHAALVFKEKTVTFRHFDERANQLANYLIHREGVLHGDRVAVLMERSIELIIALMGVIKAGAAYVPLDPKLPAERLRVVFNDACIGVVISQQRFIDKLALLQEKYEGFHSLLSMDDLANEIEKYPMTRTCITGVDNPAYVMYTSGSSGVPKGVLVEHQTIVNTLIWRKNFYDYHPGNVSLQIPPYFFDSSVTDIFTPLLGGARLVLVSEDERADLTVLKEVIPANNVSHFIAVPAFYNVLLEEIADYLKYVKMICCAGEHFPDELIRKHFEKLPGVRIVNEYGPTENSVNTTAYDLAPDSPKALIGKPISNAAVTIRDRHLGLCPIGVGGEICLSGSSLARGYLNRPELTAEKFLHLTLNTKHLTLYRSGDLGRWLADGNLEFLGRVDTQVKIRGIRVETGEIENHLMQYDGIKEVVVLARDGFGGEKYLCAYVVSSLVRDEDGRTDLSRNLKAYLSGKLPEYMVPSYFVPIDKIPLTPSGKIDRKALPVPDVQEENDYVSPRDEMEKKLVDIWSGVLGVEKDKIGIDTNFFQLGGHSLKATLLLSWVHKELNVTVPLAEIFKTPFIRGLAAFIKNLEEYKFSSIEPVEKREYYDLSSPQERLFILHQMEETGTGIGYNIPSMWIVEGHADKSKLENTFVKLIDRHESLRTSFHIMNGKPVQQIHDWVDFEIEYYDLTTGDTISDFIRPFALAKAPLLRVGFSQREKENHLLMLDMHHIISDGASIDVLVKDFTALYREEELPGLRIQYKDFSQWQNIKEQHEEIKQQAAYWLKQFEGEVPVLNLPIDYSRPLVRDLAGRSIHFEIDKNENQSLKSLAHKEGATLFMVLLSIYTIFLAKLSGQENIVVGTPAAGRRHADLQPIIGMFVNTLAMRNFPISEKNFSQFLKEVKERAIKAFENQDYPFEDLVKQKNIEVERDTSRNPLFDTIFSLQNFNIPAIEIPGLTLEPYTYENRVSTFDLALTVVEGEEQLPCIFEYNTALFKGQSIERFIHYFKKIISTVFENDTVTLSEIEIITGEEKRKILYDFNDTAREYPADKTIHQLFQEEVERIPDHIAVIDVGQGAGGTALTYKELNKKSNQLAHDLLEKGVQPNSIVALMAERSIEMILGIMGILKSGAAYMPIDLRYPGERIRCMLADSSTSILLTTRHLSARIKEFDGPGVEVIFIDDHSLGQGKVLDRLSKEISAKNGLTGTQKGTGTDLAYVIYTSGTTAQPKGVLTMHHNVTRVVKNTNYIDITAQDRVLQLSNYAFDGSVFDIYGALLNGAALVIAEQDQLLAIDRLAALVKREQVTLFFVTTALFNTLVDMQIDCFHHIRVILFGGERVSVAHARKALDYMGSGRILHVYGPTETTVFATYYPIDEIEEKAYTIPIGKPLANTSLYILSKYLHPQPLGISGEVYIGGMGNARGYLNCPELTAEKFLSVSNRSYRSYRSYISKKIYKTGDLARWLADGNIEFLGRIDHQVKIRGFRIELGEIENRLSRLEGVKEAIVLAQSDEQLGKYLCAYIVPGNQAQFEIPKLRENLAKYLPDYMIPSYFVPLAEIPLNPNGKVDRKALPLPGIQEDGNYAAPQDEIEKKLAVMWSEELGIEKEKISINENFFHLGGHSLKVTSLAARIQKELQVNVPLAEIFKTPSIRGLAAFIKNTEKFKFLSIEPVEKKEYYDLSSAQKRLFILQQMEEPGTGIGYNIPSMWILEGHVDKSKFEQPFIKLINRHESLRTSFHMVKGEPVQMVLDEVEFEIEEAAITDFIRPFDLSTAPLFRAGLCQVEKENYLLMIDFHHIISDGTSINVLVKDFIALYREEELPGLRIQYKDFSQWQDSQAQKETIKQEEAYWLKEFAGEIPVLNLPTDYSRPSIQDFEGRAIHFEVGEKESHGLKSLAHDQGATLFMVLLSSFTIFLAKISGQEDIVVGTPIAGRRHADLEQIIGMFVNTLALRNFPTGEKTFIQFLKEVNHRTLKALENQDYPFEELVERVNVARDAGRNPLFDTMLTLQDIDNRVTKIPGLALSPYDYDTGTAKFDLSLTCREIAEKLFFTLEYSTTLFTGSTIRQWCIYFKKILSAVAGHPGKRLSEIEIITAEEKKLLLHEFNDTAAEYPGDKTIHRLFEEQVERTPDHIAVVGSWQLAVGNVSVTYAELNRKSNQLAYYLIENGVQPDTVVGLMVEPCIHLMIGMLGILKAGGAYLPIDPDIPQKRIEYILKDSNTRILLSEVSELSKVSEGTEVVKISELSEQLPTHPTHLCYVIYTSGSTGRPKGVGVEHRQLVNFVYHMYNRYDRKVDFNDRCLSLTNIMFDVSVWEFFLPLLFGAQLVIMPEQERFDPFALVEVIRQQGITLIYLPPGLLKPVNDLLTKQHGRLPLNKMLVGVEPIRDEVLEDYMRLNPRMKIINGYGPTETTICASSLNYVSHPPEGEIVPIGKPLSNNQIVLLDAADRLVPLGIPGETCISGDGVSRGYINNPELTGEKYTPHPYFKGRRMYRTGDMARWLPGGNIRFIGRRDQQVKIRGYRVELGEIENRLLQHQDIKQALVVARTHETAGKYLCAYLVTGGSLEISVLQEYLSGYLPHYMIPSYFIQLEKIPLTPNGKVDYKALPLPVVELKGEDYAAPGSRIEKQIAVLWADVLGIGSDQIGIDADFFHLGGNSLRAASVVSHLHRVFNVKIPLAQLFVTPTIRALASFINNARKDQYASIQPAEKKEYYPLSPAQKRMYLLQQMVPNSVVYNMPQFIPLRGEIDKQRLERVFTQLIQRHESLRTSFHMIGDEPFQRIHKTNYKFQVTTIINDFVRPFDLSKTPLLRAGLIKDGEQKHILLVDMHHIITDGMSQAVLKDEFNQLSSGKSGDLAPLRLHYKDYAQWQTHEEQQNSIKEQESYWLTIFSEEVPVLNLPCDYPRPLIQDFAGCTVEFILTPGQTRSLDDLAKQTGSTLYMVISAVFNILLSKLSGQEDIIVGTAAAGRRHHDLKSIIGMFVNTLPIRNHPAGGKGFKDFLREVKVQVLQAFENQDYPFEELVDKLNVRKDPGRNPVFDVMFNLLNQEEFTGDLPGLDEYKHEKGFSKFDLTLSALDIGDRVLLAFEYCTKLFKPGTIERFISYFKRTADMVLENPDQKLWQLEIITESEKQQILYKFNDTKTGYPRDITIQGLFAGQVERTPDNTALHGCMIAGMHGEDVSITYKELNQRTDQLAHYLIEKGVLPDSIVGIKMERSVEMIIGILGIMKSGGAYLPIDPGYPQERIDFMLKDSGAKVLLTNLSEGHHFHHSSFNTHHSAHLAYIIYTSGSTGRPRGVMVEHGALVNLCTWHNRFYSVTPRDRATTYAAVGFDASVWEIFPYLSAGASLHLVPEGIKLDMTALNRYFETHRITIAFLPTPVCEQFMELENHSLRLLLTGGDRLTGYTKRNYRLFNNYGPTENTVVAAACRVDKPAAAIPIGKPIQDNLIFILNPGYGHVQPIGVAGELCIGGESLARGYLNRPELTAEKFDHDLWDFQDYRDKKNYQKFLRGSRGRFFQKEPPGRRRQKLYKTGDLARWLPDGNIEFLGRMDFQVKIRGFRVELGEIENRLKTHPGIKEAVVINRNDRGRQYLCAYFVVSPTAGQGIPGIPELKEYLEGKLPGYMIPACLVKIEKVPLGPNGKVDRNRLPQPLDSDFFSGGTYELPESNMQRIIAGIWQEVLGRETIGIRDNFFDLGGNSLDFVNVRNQLKEKLGIEIPIVDLFTYPTIRSLELYLNRDRGDRLLQDNPPDHAELMDEGKGSQTGLEIAVIGMVGRFPGAKDINTFWENLKNSVVSMTFFSDEELLEAGSVPEKVRQPGYVKAKGYVEDIEYFDSFFFDYTPKEAAIMDPQVRLFHQCAWHALEDAGYEPGSYNGLIGLYAGYSPNILWKAAHLLQTGSSSEILEAGNLNSSYFSTLICYKLNLRGPGVTVDTACSTSLVAIHLACRALLSGEADIVLAGGASITLPAKSGYLYEEGMVMSPDGLCRPFDAKANGTAAGNGVGIVVLKRLVKALKDRDHIYAVIKGTAINNDGNRKPGYTAPSVEAQAEVIRAAQRTAGVETETITYIETHGTGTPLGDPIEFQALKKAFSHIHKKRFCRLGFLKANIGHLDAAAGVAGFIKTVLALKHRLIPPAVNFASPNPEIDLENSPFYVNTTPEEWNADGFPLRAGVSSFGIGGTNAHVILENWEPVTGEEDSSTEKLILLSAKTQTALDHMTQDLAHHFKRHPDLNLADAAYTLQVGRQACNYRRMLVCPDKNEAIEGLLSDKPGSLHNITGLEDRPVVFMFPGLGDQYVNMGLELYRSEPRFRQEMDRCFDLLNTPGHYDLKEILYPSSVSSLSSVSSVAKTPPDINRIEVSQLVVFIFEYALAQLLMKWGIKPHSLIGYSFGEYIAACLAGVFSLEDALTLVTLRGKLIRDIPGGAMLSVPINKETVTPLLNHRLSVAIDNGDSCVVAGPIPALDQFETHMREKRYLCIRLQASHAIHTMMMDPILKEFETRVGQLTLNKPKIPFISNVTGNWISPEDAVNPRYWATHLRETVQFSKGLKELMSIENAVFLEVGPGVALSTLAHQYIQKKSNHLVVNLVRSPEQKISDIEYLLKKIGRLWLYGTSIDWSGFYANEKRNRVPLPGYPFDRLSYSVDLPLQNLKLNDQEGVIKLLEQAPPSPAPAPAATRPENKVPYAAPRNRAEQILAQMWEELLGLKPIGIHNNLLEMGVNSLKGITFVNRFKEQLGEIIHVTAIFDAPTVSELAAYFSKHYPESFARVTGMQTVEETGQPLPKETVTYEKIMRYRRFLPDSPVPSETDTHRNPPAVFVLSPPRTGSTLLRVMLAGHPALFAPPELNLLYYNTLGQRKNALTGAAASHLQGTLHAIKQIKNCSVEEAQEIMADFENRDITVKEFYHQVQQWLGDRLLVDKSPGYASDLEILKQAERYFQNARYIHLLRHPYGMIHSYVEAKMDLLGGQRLTDMLSLTRRELAEVIWTNSVYNILEFLKQVPEERQLWIRCEELVAKPEETARNICRFLHLEFHPGMIQPYKEKKQRMTDGVYSQGQMIGDPKFHQHKTINPSVAHNWKQHYKKDFLGEPTWEIAAALGYKPIHEDEASIKELDKDANSKIAIAVSENLWKLNDAPGADGDIFFIHEVSGEVGVYLEFCRHLDTRFNCWGIQADRLKNYTPQHWTIEEIAEKYIHKIKKVQPQGPYNIVTWSSGGNTAFEMAWQLEQMGDSLGLLAFVDCGGPMGLLNNEIQEFTLGTEKRYIKENFPGTGIEAKLERVTDIDHIWPFVVDLLKSSDSYTAELKKSLMQDPILAMLNFEGLRVEDAIQYLNLTRTLINSAAHYIPAGKIKTPIYFFAGSQSKRKAPEHWKNYCNTPVTYHQVSGDHYSIFQQPHVKEFARLFNELIRLF